MTLERKSLKPGNLYPTHVFFDKMASRFIPFLYIITGGDAMLWKYGYNYTKIRNGHISQGVFWRFFLPKEDVKVTKGTIILIDEFEKRGGCEDDLWV